MNALKALAPYAFVLGCIVLFVPLPVWSANTVGFLALMSAKPEPEPEPEPEPVEEPPPKPFDDATSFDGALFAWAYKHRDQGDWTLKFEARENRIVIVDFMSDSGNFSRAEKLAQKIIDAWMRNELDPYTKDVTLYVTTTRLRKKASPTKRDVYVPTDAIAYNLETDAYENAMSVFRDARKDSAYLWGVVAPQRLPPKPGSGTE